jgi:hypothetical protein
MIIAVNNNNLYYYCGEGECSVCFDTTSGSSRQFYTCLNIGTHYLCNYCYMQWHRQHPRNGCPTCRAPHRDRP